MKKLLSVSLAAFFCLSLLLSPVLAQEKPSVLDKISLAKILNMEVTSVGFFSMDVEKAPGFTQNFLMEDIDTSSVRTLGDLVDSQVIGMVYGMNEAMGCLIGSRGVLIDNNAKTLVMLEEQQLHARSHGYSDWFMTPFLGDIKSIEAVNGPGAIVHGSGAINGFFNLIPKNGTDNPGFESRIEYGQFEELAKLELSYGMSYGDENDLFIYGGVLDADGSDEVDFLWGGRPDDGREPKAYGYPRSNFRVASYWHHGDFSMNAFFTKINPMTNSHWRGKSYFHHGMMGVRPKYTWHFNDENTLDIMLSGEMHDVGLDEEGSSKESHIEAKIIYKTLSLDKHQIAVGGLYGKRKFKGKEQYFSDDYEKAYPIQDAKWTEIGVFAEDVITWDKFTASIGLRWDIQVDSEHVTDPEQGTMYKVPEEGHLSPRIAASYEITENSVLKASFQQGFRNPDANYYNSTKVINDKIESLGLDERMEALKPETMDSYEIGLHQEISEGRLNLDINLYYNKYKNQLTWKKMDEYLSNDTVKALDKKYGWWNGAVDNLKEEFESYGTEFIVYWTPLENVRLRLGYGFAETDGSEVERYHSHQIKTNIKTSFFDDRLVFDLTNIWNSKLPSGESRHEAYEDDRLVFDMAVQYSVTENVSVKAMAKNMFENETPVTGYTIGDPTHGHLGENERRFYISLNVKL
ncbi:MAG: TonB-dependent receptor [Desulfobacterales bacterium]|nr:TonB-dependent receptor [Desulfobacterales bacterium]